MVKFSSTNQSYSSSTPCISLYQHLITDLGQKALVINNYEAFCKIAVVRIADTFEVDYVRIWQIGSDGHSLYQVVNYGFSSTEEIKSINIESHPPLGKIITMATHLASIATENSRYTMNLEKEITEKNQALQALKKIQTQLIQSEKLSSLGQLSAGIVHEINNPMSCIVANLPYIHDYIQTLLNVISIYEKNYPQYTSEIASALENFDLDFIKADLINIINSMTDSTQRIRDISHSILTFTRADNDQKVFYNLHEGLDSTFLILKHRLKSQGNRPEIQVVKEYGNIPNFKCFPGQINQVFLNLLTNALDAIESFGFSKSHQITVKTSVNSDGSAILITIQDTGIGISEEVKSHLFEYLYTTKEVGKGTGLGLSISQQIIVEKHDGEITCSSAIGEGTSFIIRLPI